MKRLFILIAALILAVNSAYALPRSVALRNSGNQAGYERLVRGLEPTLWLATDEGITVSGSNVTQWDSLVSLPNVERIASDSHRNNLSAWTSAAITVTADQETSPFTGLTVIDHLGAQNSGGQHYAYSGLTTVSGKQYRASAVVKAAEETTAALGVLATNFGGLTTNVLFDLSGESTTPTGAVASSDIVSLGNGWYEISFVTTAATASGATSWFVAPKNANSYTPASAGDGVYIGDIDIDELGTPISFTQSTVANQPLLSTSGVENLVQYSDDATNAYWTDENFTITTGQADSEGGTNAMLLDDATSNALHRVYPTSNIGGIVAGESYRVSFRFKYIDQRWFYVRLRDSGSTDRFAWIDFQNATTGTVQTNLTASVTPLGSDWYRADITVSAAASAISLVYGFASADASSASYTGANNQAYIHGMQLARASMSNAYASTTNAPIHGSLTGRKGVVFDGSASSIASTSTLDDIFNADAKEGFVVLRPNQLSAAANQDILYDSGVDLIWRIIASSTNLQFYNDDGGGDSTTVSTTTTPQVVNYRHDGTNIYLLGATESSTASGSTASMAGTLTIGKRATAASEYLDGAIYEIITFDKVLSDNQRQAIIEGLESRYRID